MSEEPRILNEIDDGGPAIAERLVPLVYDELRQLAAYHLSHETPGQTLQPTALVHEAYLRLVKEGTDKSWDSKGHFFSAAAEAMRRILIEKARHKKSNKRGGGFTKLDLSNNVPTVTAHSGINILDLDQALTKLESEEPRKAQLVKLRCFGGLTLNETAKSLGISSSTADSDWAYAKAWLKVELSNFDLDFE